ncbi:MAG TPA: serine protein kinase RIO [Candidatus Lokiarchaeia archaeon]|nr:serine protein kinase RIO [Candidatus Lokiarchaeia archaeon]
MVRDEDADKYLDDLSRHKVDFRTRRVKRSEDRDTVASVLDARTQLTLHDMLGRGIIKALVGIISAGKEANVYLGTHEDGSEIAVKVYKIDSQSAKWMQEYMHGDPRFSNVGTSVTSVIFTWARKEFKNLSRAKNHDLPVPTPLKIKDNVLLMQFIGEGGTPAPRLKDAEVTGDMTSYYAQVVDFMRDLYQKCQLVHADLSEYNILYWKGEITIIDMSQSVLNVHPKARFYLSRDIKNINAYFEKWGVDVRPPMDIYQDIIQE